MSDLIPVVTEVYEVGQVVTVDGRSGRGRVVGRRYDAEGKTVSILVDFFEGTQNCAGFIPRIESVPAEAVKVLQ